jgi:hypothetical protein
MKAGSVALTLGIAGVVLGTAIASCAGAHSGSPIGQPASAADPAARSLAPTTTARPASGALTSDEGMWLLNDFPSERLRERYGFAPTKEWLDHVRLSSVRLTLGCSGSVVSPDGLVMTNHHCAEECIAQLSTSKKDFVQSGFFAKSEKDEVKCPDIEANQLIEIVDVTARVNEATKGSSGAAYNDAQRAEISRIEKECTTTEEVRCDVVSLYHGGLYHLYKYRRMQDVRLVFAPEIGIAAFGGDPDNFMFPRYDLDVSFLRLYDHDHPVKTNEYFRWSKAGAKQGELTFISGHPGSTSRELTVSQLEYFRDVRLPAALVLLAFYRGILIEFGARGPEQKRTSNSTLLDFENNLKATKGRHEALLDRELFARKIAEEQELRAKVAADPRKAKLYGGAWDAIAAAERTMKRIRKPYQLLELGRGFSSSLFETARTLVRSGDELPKANEKRLREYVDSKLPALKQGLFSSAPVYDEFETLMLTTSLGQLREDLGPDDPVVKKVLGKQSPAELAQAVIKGTKLKDVKVRKALFDGGKAAVDASKDPMILLALLVDPDARNIRKRYEDEVEAVVKQQGELIAKAKFEIYGTSVYPDATFSLRVSFGQVKGWNENGTEVEPFTTLAGAFARDTGREPFALPKRWLAAKSRLNLETPFNFTTTNDLIGGNSGSPMINKEAEIVGLIFDGNIHSLGGEYAYDPRENRAVAVHSASLKEALDKVYGAARILSEIQP